jgi:hypothetical protein
VTRVEHTAVQTEALAPVHVVDTDRRFLYGIVAEFHHAHDVVSAARLARERGYEKMDAYAPFPVEGLAEALGKTDMKVPWTMLAGGIFGGVGGFAFLAWSTIEAYPLNIGGRPLYAWPSWIPITFELTVLLAALSGIVGMFWYNGLPEPYHPVFDAPNFDQATSDRFFLCIEAEDALFDTVETREFLENVGAVQVTELERRL